MREPGTPVYTVTTDHDYDRIWEEDDESTSPVMVADCCDYAAAKHLADCANACEGFDPEKVREMLTTAKAWLEWTASPDAIGDSAKGLEILQAAKAAFGMEAGAGPSFIVPPN